MKTMSSAHIFKNLDRIHNRKSFSLGWGFSHSRLPVAGMQPVGDVPVDSGRGIIVETGALHNQIRAALAWRLRSSYRPWDE
jgi:hypothetical protein